MKHYKNGSASLRAVLVLLVVLVAAVSFSTAQQKALDSTPKPEAKRALVEPSEVDQLAWQNLRLRAQNVRLQIQSLEQSAQQFEREADEKLQAINKTVGDDYTPAFENGKLVFKLKPPTKPEERPKQ